VDLCREDEKRVGAPMEKTLCQLNNAGTGLVNKYLFWVVLKLTIKAWVLRELSVLLSVLRVDPLPTQSPL
jgi:hypothetical protein